MAEKLKYEPVRFDREAFVAQQMKRRGFAKAYADRAPEYALLRELLIARARSGLTQEAVAKRMGTTKSAVSRLEGSGAHAPSITTLKRYAEAVGHRLEIRLIPGRRPDRGTRRKKPNARSADRELA